MALQEWVKAVEVDGMPVVRRIRGYHDEPLRGPRAGQRSVRLNRQWRAIYTETERGDVVIVSVQEVTPHAY
jgi:proteic killer suppression protein